MIQDIHGIYHNEYQNLTPEQEDYVMFVQGRSVLMSRDSEQTIRYITYGELKKLGFSRTKTLGYGGDCCDFHFYKK